MNISDDIGAKNKPWRIFLINQQAHGLSANTTTWAVMHLLWMSEREGQSSVLDRKTVS